MSESAEQDRMQTLRVELGERSYPIYIGSGLLEQLADLASLGPNQHIALVSNPTVYNLYGEAVMAALAHCRVDVFLMEDGEQYKTLQTYAALLDFLMQKRHNRTTCLLALGGGVVGDITGFVAATFQRGVDFVQIPTTLLAQVDSSVGGKTAVNHPGGKNMIGAFYQPRSVIADTDVLLSLPPREFAAGMAEVVKYGLIADATLFDWLMNHVDDIRARQAGALSHMLVRSCEIKADVVAQDEREAGLRAILNFGHTFGHAIEKVTAYNTLLHGEAVGLGMLMAVDFSEQAGFLPKPLLERLRGLLSALDLPVELPAGLAPAELLSAMGMDKKVADGQVRLVVINAVGQVQLTAQYDQQQLQLTLQRFCQQTGTA